MANLGLRIGLAIAVAAPGFGASELRAQSCRLQSPSHRVAVLELYTSEGCNSCPPADRWLSGLPQKGVSADKAVLLAFHVDYWDQLGWPDRFSKAAFSDRQREVAARASRGVIYTPQVVLDGRDMRQAYTADALQSKLAAINREAGQATISATAETVGNELRVGAEIAIQGSPPQPSAQTWVAVFERGLSSRVTGGENAGKMLHHDFVVRELAGPFAIGSDGRGRIDRSIKLSSDWNVERTGVAIFVQRRDDGRVLQAASSYPLCAP